MDMEYGMLEKIEIKLIRVTMLWIKNQGMVCMCGKMAGSIKEDSIMTIVMVMENSMIVKTI